MFRHLKGDEKINCLTTALIYVGTRAEVTYHPLFLSLGRNNTTRIVLTRRKCYHIFSEI